MSKHRLLEDQIKALEESVKFYAPENKPEREMWVVRSFLKNLSVDFSENEVQSSATEPPDVLYKDAHFEIKEILDVGRRRHTEYKAALEKARSAEDPKELLEKFAPLNSSAEEIFCLCLAEVEKLDKKYPSSVRKNLDLLFYVNLKGVMEVTEEPFPDVSGMRTHQWRSISFVEGYRSCCFTTEADAPSFLCSALGKIVHRSIF